jgi:hypothetical protein
LYSTFLSSFIYWVDCLLEAIRAYTATEFQ